MQLIVDEIDKETCPFYVKNSWDNRGLPIQYDEGCCRLDTYPFGGELQQDPCYAKKGDKECLFCITYDEFKRRMNGGLPE